MVSVSAIIVTMNSVKVIDSCLETLSSQSFKDMEVIVVDNNSNDGTQEHIKNKFPKVRLFALKDNKGYSGAVNYGINNSKGDYVFFTNDDVFFDKDFIKSLYSKKDSADVLGCKIYYAEPKDRIWTVWVKLNPLSAASSLVGKGEIDHGQYDTERYVTQTVGTLFAKKDLFEKVGYFREDYFLYYEETEWFLRNKGLKILYVPGAKMWHKVSFSSGGDYSPRSLYYIMRNRLYLIKQYWPALVKPLAILTVYAEVLVRVILYTSKGKKDAAKAVLKAVQDFNHNVIGHVDLKF